MRHLRRSEAVALYAVLSVMNIVSLATQAYWGVPKNGSAESVFMFLFTAAMAVTFSIGCLCAYYVKK